jgi:hypothetical protein
MSGMWLLPTRRRVDVVKRFLAAAVDKGMRLPGTILVNNAELSELSSEYAALGLPPGWRIMGVEADCICATMREAIPIYKDLDFVGTVTDDVVPETDGWEQKLLEWHDGATIISCNDGSQAPRRMAGAIIWPVALFRAVGYWVPNTFRHCFVDDLWESLGRECGCWRIRMDVTVRHLHPWVTGEEDDTHKHSYSKEFWDNDKAAYENWQLYYKARAVERLSAFVKEKRKVAA